MENSLKKSRIAVLVPCHNEALTIGDVIADLKKHVPDAAVFVFDNNSTDGTADIAKSMGATVVKEKRQGKGYVVQSMFSRVDADVYIMVDGDSTYDLALLPNMIAMVAEDEADMVVGNRLKMFQDGAFRPFHTFGNKLVKVLINRLFRGELTDIMSGLRVMNREFVKKMNITSSGFEVETEMTLKALKYGYVIKELDIRYGERPAGSYSKLSTMKDGMRVLRTIFIIFKEYKPLLFFAAGSLFFFLVSLLSGSVVIDEFIKTRYIRHVPLAILASGAMILSIIFLVTGIILDSVNRRFEEVLHFMRNRE